MKAHIPRYIKNELSLDEKRIYVMAERQAELIDLKFLSDFIRRFVKRYGYKPKI